MQDFIEAVTGPEHVTEPKSRLLTSCQTCCHLCCPILTIATQEPRIYRITGFNCVLKSLRFRDFKVIVNLNIAFVWHMSYYLNRSGYPLVLVLGTKCLVRTRSCLVV